MPRRRRKFRETLSGQPLKLAGSDKFRKDAISGRLSTNSLEKYIAKMRNLGYPIKYTKPTGFKRD